ncbi:MAG: MucB/RseB C-terminal domain-containing protein [Pseudomonadales bacterium]
MGVIRQRFHTAIFGICAFIASTLAGAEPVDPATIFSKMAESLRSQTYDGVMVSNRNGEMRSMRIVHMVRNGEELERIQYLDGKAREIIRAEHPLDCVHTGGKLVLGNDRNGLFSVITPAGVEKLKGHYRLERRPETRVAGRAVTAIAVLPNDAYRYGRLLYIDQASYLLLKAEVLDKQGKVLEGFQFTQLTIGDKVDPAAIDTVGSNIVEEGFHMLPPNGSDPMDSAWQLGWMPDGFVRASHQKHAIKGSDKSVQSMHYTDGMSVFSVFIESANSSIEAFQTTSGSTTAYVAPMKTVDGWLSVTVVGEVPLIAAIKIAQSINEAQPVTAMLGVNGLAASELSEP